MNAGSCPAEQWPGRATRAVIDLDALAANVRYLLSRIGSRVGLMAVVKANGYGHGATMIARAALDAGCSRLAVATVDEGTCLRDAGIEAPILVLGPVDPSEVENAIGRCLTLTISDRRLADHVGRVARSAASFQLVPVHVKVDTGMRRFGAMPEATPSLVQYIATIPALSIEGVFTHLASADDPDQGFARQQADEFDRCVAAIRATGVDPGLLHVANSAATLTSPRFHYDLVRVGIALYGLPPAATMPLPPEMRPVMSLRSRVGRVIELAPGDTVSYGRAYAATTPERAALVPIGYADGYRRGLSSRGWMGVRGCQAPVRGRVCMDQTVVGLPDGIDIAVGDDVVVVGNPADGAPTMHDLAELTGTIAYEMATGVSERVPRVYVRQGRVVAVANPREIRMPNTTEENTAANLMCSRP